MSQSSVQVVELASRLRTSGAGDTLPPVFAKLYSQFTLLSSNQPGLFHWQANEAGRRLNDAMRILEAGFIEKDAGIPSWYLSVRRSAEIFEWISIPKIKPEGVPTRLFSAALYQISGYPARASGILANPFVENDETTSSLVLTNLLKANFPSLMKIFSQYWRDSFVNTQILNINWQDPDRASDDLNNWLFDELVSSLGIVCSSMRWGKDERLLLALEKLNAISKIFLRGNDNFSGLLSKLVYEVNLSYVNSTLRSHTDDITKDLDENGNIAFERYIRQAYQSQRSLVWPSQIRGIERLKLKTSFALCTPTGSGKTTVAEIAILQSLFDKEINKNPDEENKLAT